MSRRHLVAFTRSLAVLVQARLPLLDALAGASPPRPGRLQHVLEGVRRGIRGGASLADSLARYPDVFDGLYVQLTRVGEAAGVLDVVLLRLAVHLEKAEALRRKVLLALVYPGVVLGVAVGATVFLLTAILPTFAALFRDFGAVLPMPTRVMLRASSVLVEHGLLVLAAASLGGLALATVGRTPAGRMARDRLTLRLPLAGPLVRKSLAARFCRMLGTLLASGIALTDALALLAHAVGNRAAEHEVGQVLERVRGGSSLKGALRQVRLFPDLVVQMAGVGEETAELDRMLLHAAAYYEREVDAVVETLTAVVEPVMIVLVGLVLGAILVAMYLPMFDLIGVVG